MPSRKPPADVARILRTEVGFGCAKCGCPILEYHHIIPWAERNHHDVEHMVALCSNHHKEADKQNKEAAYTAKKNPFNIRHKRFKGGLVTNKKNQALVLGNTRFVGYSNAISYLGIPLFGHSVEDGVISVNCFIPDANFFPEIEVKANNLEAIKDGFWDIEFKLNYIKFRRKKGEIFLAMDFRKDDVEVRGRFEIEGREYRFSPNRCDFGGNSVGGNTMIGLPGDTAIIHGATNMKLLRPNYAMRTPRPTYTSK